MLCDKENVRYFWKWGGRKQFQYFNMADKSYCIGGKLIVTSQGILGKYDKTLCVKRGV